MCNNFRIKLQGVNISKGINNYVNKKWVQKNNWQSVTEVLFHNSIITRQAMYVQCNTEVCSSNHCCSGKANKHYIFYIYCSVHHNILWNNQQMQLYAVNFIPLLGSLYMFRAAHTPIIRSTMFNRIYSHLYKP